MTKVCTSKTLPNEFVINFNACFDINIWNSTAIGLPWYSKQNNSLTFQFQLLKGSMEKRKLQFQVVWRGKLHLPEGGLV